MSAAEVPRMILKGYTRKGQNPHIPVRAGALVGGAVRQAAVARAPSAACPGKLFMPQSLRHATREQQPIQCTLIFSQHSMWSTRCESNAHQTELASTVSSDRIYQIKGLLLSTVPNDLNCHESGEPRCHLWFPLRSTLRATPGHSQATVLNL
jgi:hypothetical protein